MQLDTPGHCLDHMCGLARTTGGPESTFILLGGDICHFPGAFRPTAQLSLPDPIPNGTLDTDAYFPSPCPCSLFTDHHPLKSKGFMNASIDSQTSPFYRVSTDSAAAYVDPVVSQRSVDRLVDFDASPSILICLAHDTTMLRDLPTLNDSPEDDLNSWQQRGYKKKIQWGWLNDLPRNGKPAREMVVQGFWREKQPWPGAKVELRKNGEKASRIGL